MRQKAGMGVEYVGTFILNFTEVFFVWIFIPVFLSRSVKTGIILFLFCCLLFLLLKIYYRFFSKPADTKLLCLFGHAVCMKFFAKTYRDAEKKAVEDFLRMITYARKKGMDYLTIDTHEYVLYRIFKNFSEKQEKGYRRLKEGELGNYPLRFGTLTVCYRGEHLNLCAGSRYSFFEKWKNAGKIFKKRRFYRLKLEL